MFIIPKAEIIELNIFLPVLLVDVCDDAAGVGRVEVALSNVAGEVGHQVLAGHVHPHPARLHHLQTTKWS